MALATPKYSPIAVCARRFTLKARKLSPGGRCQMKEDALDALAGLTLLCAMGAMGIALLRRLGCSLDPLEQLAYGFPLGIVATSLALLATASLTGTLGWEIVVASGAVSVGIAAASWPRRQASAARGAMASGAIGWAAVVVIGLIGLRWAAYWRSALVLAPDGLWAGSVNIWGDWSQHLGDVTAFAYGDNFPPTNPRLAGQPFAYHYLSSLTVAAMVPLGLDPVRGLPLHSCVLSLFVALGIYALARRLTGRDGAAALALLLFALGGGLGWWFQLAKLAPSQDGWHALRGVYWDAGLQASSNLLWPNMFFALLAPQRALLYGLPLGLLSLTLLFTGIETRRNRDFVVAGVSAGLLPLAHLGTLLALALITPFLYSLFPRRQWVLFFAVWCALALPQLWLQQSGGPGAMSAMRVQLGWVAGPDAWPWFWLKNLGLFVPLAAVALVRGDPTVPRARRFLAGFMPLFLIANAVVFQPWAWDNTKVLAYWFLACCILVAALVSRAWESGGARGRVVIAVMLATMVGSGLLENLSQARGRDRHLLLTAEELRLATSTRARTPSHAVLVVGLRHNHPITLLTGRRVVLGYPGWMWSQGLHYQRREQALGAIFALTEDAPRLLQQYGVDYVVIGPDERQRFAGDLEGYRARFPTLLRTENYEIFAVSPATRAIPDSALAR
jgi:hypothetical protein